MLEISNIVSQNSAPHLRNARKNLQYESKVPLANLNYSIRLPALEMRCYSNEDKAGL